MIEKKKYNLEIPKREKGRQTYSQDWPAYNAAQTNEKMLFLSLLRELVDAVPELQEKL